MSRFAGTHRVTRIAAAAAGVAAIMFASACGAGQVAETAKITPAVPGASGSTSVPAMPGQPSSAGQILVQNATFAYSGVAGYPAGTAVPLNLRIINNSGSDVRLTAVTASYTTESGASKPLGTVEPAGRGARPAPTPTSSAPASPSPAPTPAPVSIDIKIPARQIVELVPGSDLYLQVSNLAEDFTPGHSADLTFTFTNASSSAGTIDDLALVGVPIGPPTAPPSRTAVVLPSSSE